MLSEPPYVLSAVRPDRRGEERHTVAGEPERGGEERLGVGSDGAPGELRVAVCGQVRGDLLYELREPPERHEQPGGEGDRQIDYLDYRRRGGGPREVAHGESEKDEGRGAQEQAVGQGSPGGHPQLDAARDPPEEEEDHERGEGEEEGGEGLGAKQDRRPQGRGPHQHVRLPGALGRDPRAEREEHHADDPVGSKGGEQVVPRPRARGPLVHHRQSEEGKEDRGQRHAGDDESRVSQELQQLALCLGDQHRPGGGHFPLAFPPHFWGPLGRSQGGPSSSALPSLVISRKASSRSAPITSRSETSVPASKRRLRISSGRGVSKVVTPSCVQRPSTGSPSKSAGFTRWGVAKRTRLRPTRALMAAAVPSARTRPRSMTTTRSAKASASSR